MTHLIWFICIGWVGIHAEWRGTQQFPVLYWLYIIYYMFNRILYIIYCYNYNLFDPTDLFCNILHFSCRISVKHHDLAKMWSHCWRSQIWIFHIMCRHNTVMFCRYRSFCVLVIKYKNLLMSIMFLLHLKRVQLRRHWKTEKPNVAHVVYDHFRGRLPSGQTFRKGSHCILGPAKETRQGWWSWQWLISTSQSPEFPKNWFSGRKNQFT